MQFHISNLRPAEMRRIRPESDSRIQNPDNRKKATAHVDQIVKPARHTSRHILQIMHHVEPVIPISYRIAQIASRVRGLAHVDISSHRGGPFSEGHLYGCRPEPSPGAFSNGCQIEVESRVANVRCDWSNEGYGDESGRGAWEVAGLE
jgi:hypothetical protein